ncbi:MAG: zinc dependent phospholipase C family protein [Gallionella sp.]|nr:zinc dependent phospholipase C family protein [Gallionella sp.]
MRNVLRRWHWFIPLALYSGDALAWGLYTHVYFAQLLLWAIPLTDPNIRRAVAAYPRLVLAGACLPDLSLVGRYLGAAELDETHRWECVHKQIALARNDEELALTIGFASHLLVDVIAHNHFVPAHERMWIELPLLTHAAAEWAMDAHIRPHLYVSPAELLDQHRHELTAYMARNFDCRAEAAWRSMRVLANAEALLRTSRLPQLCYLGSRLLDERLRHRFNYYLRETSGKMAHINRILSGEAPLWHAESPCLETTRARIGLCLPHQVRGRMPLPQDLFQADSDAMASMVPIIVSPAGTLSGG